MDGCFSSSYVYKAKRANVNKSYFYHSAINTEIFSHCQFMTIIYVPQGTNSSTDNIKNTKKSLIQHTEKNMNKKKSRENSTNKIYF